METKSNLNSGKRLFIAVPVCDEIKILNELLRTGNHELQGTKWTSQKNLHLTVFFLGETNISHIPDILKVMENVLLKTPVIELEFEKVSLEGARSGHPSMVWARFKKHPLFSQMVTEFCDQLHPYIHVTPKFADPVPHVTLARIRSGKLPQLIYSSGCSIRITGFELMESVKIPGGVEYHLIDKKYKG